VCLVLGLMVPPLNKKVQFFLRFFYGLLICLFVCLQAVSPIPFTHSAIKQEEINTVFWCLKHKISSRIVQDFPMLNAG